MSKTSKSDRYWAFTVNEERYIDQWKGGRRAFPKEVRYVCWSIEQASKIHVQGWLQLYTKTTRGKVQEYLASGKCHCDPCIAGAEQNQAYCSKTETHIEGPYTYGTMTSQGKRSDLDAIAREIQGGATDRDIAMEHPAQWIRYGRGIKDYRATIMRPPAGTFRELTNIVLIGTTGMGKTSWALENYPPEKVYKIASTNPLWWDGYMGEEVVILDEFRGEIPISTLLSLLDGYEVRLPVKCGFTWACWRSVIITSNRKVEEWYNNITQNDMKALLRRIWVVVDFRENTEVPK